MTTKNINPEKPMICGVNCDHYHPRYFKTAEEAHANLKPGEYLMLVEWRGMHLMFATTTDPSLLGEPRLRCLIDPIEE